MPKTKKKEVYYFYCPHCDEPVKFVNYDEMTAHINLVHATVYEKACRDEYSSKLPYNGNREAYQEDQRRLNTQFQRDLEVEHGVENNPKREKLFDIAWSQGHSAGYSEVAIHYDEMVVLIQEQGE
jgi:hypothetical protein